MRSLSIVLRLKGIKPLLLLKEVVCSGNDRGLLEGQMKALMPSVLLGMAGLDPLDSDSQPEPPDCQSTESKQSVGRCKRDSVVRADRCRQT